MTAGLPPARGLAAGEPAAGEPAEAAVAAGAVVAAGLVAVGAAPNGLAWPLVAVGAVPPVAGVLVAAVPPQAARMAAAAPPAATPRKRRREIWCRSLTVHALRRSTRRAAGARARSRTRFPSPTAVSPPDAA